MQSVGTPDAVFLEENLVDDAWGQGLRSRSRAWGQARRMPRAGTGSKDASDVARGDRACDPACRAWGQAPRGSEIFYAFETQGGTAGHVGGALRHRHRVHCCMFRYWESLT